MIIVLQIAGACAVLIGLVAIGLGIPVKEFSFGNTLIVVGTVGLCTGMIILALSVVASELRMVARRLAIGRPVQEPRTRAMLPPFPSPTDRPAAPATTGQVEPPWQEEPGSPE